MKQMITSGCGVKVIDMFACSEIRETASARIDDITKNTMLP